MKFKEQYEAIFQCELTENDVNTLNQELDLTWEEVENDTRMFLGLTEYVRYVYSDNPMYILENIARSLEYNDKYSVADDVRDILVTENSVTLDNNKILFLMC